MIPPADEKILEKARPNLTGSIFLDSSDLLDQLRSRGVITEHNQQIIEEEKGNRKQVAKLLDFLLRGSVDTLDKFIYSLRDSGHTELAKECLRQPHKPDNWDDDTSAGGQTDENIASTSTSGKAEKGNFVEESNPDRKRLCLEDTDEVRYPVPTTKNRGQAIIVCISEFGDKKWGLSGYEKDLHDLKHMFTTWDIDFTPCLDKTAEDIKKKVKDFAETCKDIPFVILVLLSHGGLEEVVYTQNGKIKRAEDGDVIYRKDAVIKKDEITDGPPNATYRPEEVIYGKDAKPVSVDTLRSFFSAKKCKSLINKPKLTLVQACRGGCRPEDIVTAGATGSRSTAESADSAEPAFVVNGGDEIVAYATQKDETSFVVNVDDRDRALVRGSYFIKEVCAIFLKHAANTSVTDMLTKVNYKVSKREEECDGKKAVQMPQFVSSLRGKWYLKEQ